MPQFTATTALSANQANAVQLIALGWTRIRVANHLGIDPGTLSRWRRMPLFQQKLGKLLEQSERECVDSFRAIKSIAVERLGALLNSPNQTVALKAIELVISKTDLCEKNVALIDPYAEREKAHWNGILDDLLQVPP